jgi:hypothetical protein
MLLFGCEQVVFYHSFRSLTCSCLRFIGSGCVKVVRNADEVVGCRIYFSINGKEGSL